MKKTILTSALLTMASIGLLTGSASAYTVTYLDETINFPGYNVSPADVIGTPVVEKMTVMYDETAGNMLQSINIFMTGRQVFDSLFLDVDGGGWDYMIRDNTGQYASPWLDTYKSWDSYFAIEGLYKVDPTWAYTLVPYSVPPLGIREGHPNGIAKEDLTWLQDASFVTYGAGILTYDFTSLGMKLDSDFRIAYAPWCANDVIDTVVPEPATMLLFGTGLAGLAGIARRRKMQ